MSTNKLLTAHLRGFFAGRKPRVMAHRGASGEYPENTLLAFDKAMEQGADILEMDVHLTADKRVVVCHDATLERTTNGFGEISEKVLAELKELDAGYWFTSDGGKTYPFRGKGIEIPTLSEVLQAHPDVPMNIEIKVNDLSLVHQTMRILERFGRIEKTNVLVAGQDHKLIGEIRKASPSGITGHSRREICRFLISAVTGVSVFFNGNGDAIQLPARTRFGIPVVNRRIVRAAHKHGFEIHVWTIDDEAELRRLLALGVDGIFTNFPGRMRRILDEGKKP